jgi:phage antirepressor YoqD-like protein
MLSERQLTPEKDLIGKDTIEIFKNEVMCLQCRALLNPDGSISINAEDTAIGLGWTQEKGNKTYVRWETLNAYLKDFGFSQEVGKEDFIPESLFYMLGFKAGNERAMKFQQWLAMDVLPSIRKNGLYATDQTIDKILSNPDFGIQLLTNLKVEREKNKFLTGQIEKQQQVIEAQQPKVTYYDMVLQCTSLIKTTDIAKDYGESAQWLNKYLHDKEIIFWQGNRKNGRYYLYADYAPMGYAQSQTYSYQNSKGMYDSKTHLYWTQKGRYFIYETLKADGILPIVERVA